MSIKPGELHDAAFEAGELDFAVVARHPTRSWLEHLELGHSGYLCLLDTSGQTVSLPLTLDEYLDLPHVLISYSGREGIVDQALRRISRVRHIQVALTHFSALPQFLISNRAVATLPRHAALTLAQAGALTATPVPVDLGTYPISLVWNRTAENPWMRDLIREVLSRQISALGHR